MKKILIPFAKAATGTTLHLGMSLARQKLIAVFLGPTGMGILGLLTQLQNALIPIAGLGSDKSLVQGIASKDADDKPRFLSSALVVMLTAWLVSFLFILVAGDFLGVFVLGNSSPELIQLVKLMAWPCLGLAILQFFQGTLMASGAIGSAQKAQIIGGLFGTFTAWMVGKNWEKLGDTGYLIYLSAPIFSALCVSIFYNLRLASTKTLLLNCKFSNVSKKFIREFCLFSSIIVLSGLVSGWVWLYVRKLVMEAYGAEYLGFFSATISLSGMVVTLTGTAMSGFYLPKFASSKGLERKSLFFVTFVALAICSLGYLLFIQLFASEIVHLAFSEKFNEMVPLLKIWAFGDLIRLLSYVFAFSILSLSLKRVYVITEIVTNVVSLCLYTFSVSQKIPFASLGYINITIYSVYFVMCYVLLAKARTFEWK